MKNLTSRIAGWLCVSVAGACLVMAADAFAQNTVSRPAGFVRKTVEAGADKALALPFSALYNDINNVIGAQIVPDEAGAAIAVRKWDAVNQVYLSAYLRAGKWYDAPNGEVESMMTLDPGEGFMVHNGDVSAHTVFLAGSVVMEPTVLVDLYPGLTLVGYPFSTFITLGGTAIPFDGNVDADTALLPGEGYWYQQDTDGILAWSEQRPYEDLFPAEDQAPAIIGLAPLLDGSVMLNILCSGDAGERLQIFFKDVALTNVLDTGCGWQIAGSIDPQGQTVVTWGESGIGQVESRCYLIGRSDIDADADGLSDAEEAFVHGTSPSNADTDGDGVADGAEIAAGSDPLASQNGAKTYWVDDVNGKNAYNGLSSTVSGSKSGPKQTIHAAILQAVPGDTIMVQPGHYRGNVRLPSGIKMVSIGRVIIDKL